jgi:hypothetical protein
MRVIDNARLVARRALGLNPDEFGPTLTPLEWQMFDQNFPNFGRAAGAF